MRRIYRVFLTPSLILCGLLLLSTTFISGCDAFQEYQQRAKAAEADAIVMTAATGARSYFETDQMRGAEHEPWHRGDAGGDSPQPGPVGYDERVFPGGTDIIVRTSEEIPANGEPVEPDPVIEGDVDFDAEDVLNQLNLSVQEPMYFRYTFEMGSGIGDDATLTITAEANFDPDEPEHHTVIQTVEVGPGGAEIQPTDTQYELH